MEMSTVIEGKKEIPIFTYSINDNNWKLVKELIENGKCTRLYACVDNNSSLLPIYPENFTPDLIESMTLDINNYSFATLTDEQLNVVVKGIGIWSDGELYGDFVGRRRLRLLV